MAKDVITRFKIETTAFDSKIKQASKELSDYSKTATQAKEGFDEFTKANVDAARALGSIETSTTQAKDKVKELVSAYNEAARAYNNLTEEQKNSDWAKALSESLTQLQQRIKETKVEIQNLDNAQSNVGESLFGSSSLEGMLQVFGGNLMTKATDALMQMGEHIGELISQSAELAQEAEGVTIAFERLGRPELMNQLKEATHGTVSELELMKAAVKFDDFKLNVEELGTLLAFAQQKAKDTGQSVDYMVDSIVTGLGRQSLMILDNLGLSAADIRERMKETGDMTSAVADIIRDQMGKSGGYIETAADQAARAAADQQDAMMALGKELLPLKQGTSAVFNEMATGALKATAFIVRNKDTLIAIGAAVAAYTIAVNANTIAVRAQAAATAVAEAAQKALNLAMKANPYGLAAAAITGLVTAIALWSSESRKAAREQEELARKQEEAKVKADAARNTFTQASADMMNAASRIESLQKAYKDALTEFDKTDILKQAQQEFRNLGMECNSLSDAQQLLVKQGNVVIELIKAQGNVAAISALRMETFKKSFQMLLENGYGANAASILAGYNEDVLAFDKQITTLQSRISGLRKELGTGGSGNSGNTNPMKSSTTEKDEMSLNSQKITDLTNEYIKATDERRQAIEQEIATLQKRNKEIQKLKDMAQGKAFDAGQLNGEVVVTGRKSVANDKAFREAPTNFDSINTWINGVKDQLKNANLGDELYNSLTEKMKDATTMSTLLNELMERSVNGSDLTSVAEKMKAALLEGDIPDDKIKEFIDQLNEKIKEQGGIELSYNGQTGEVSDQKEVKEDDGLKDGLNKFNSEVGKLTGGLSSVSSGLKALGVDVPKEVDQMIGVINGASQVISGIGTIISLVGTSSLTANTTAVGLNTAAIVGLIAALEFNTATNFIPFFAGGGVVGRAAGGLLVGNHMSGDNLRLPVNSGGFIGVNDGELILNRSQQANIAQQLTDNNSGGGYTAQPYVDAEKIVLGVNNYFNRRGMGEIVTTKRK